MDEIDDKLSRHRRKAILQNVEKESLTTKSFLTSFKNKLSDYASHESRAKSTPIIDDSMRRNAAPVNSDEDQEITDPIRKKDFYMKLCLKLTLYFTLFAIFIKLEFGIVYFVISSIFIMYFNTSDTKKNGLSAYSVFNPNMKRIDGTVTAEQLQSNMMGKFANK